MKITGNDMIKSIVERLKFEDVRCYDAEIIKKFRSLSSCEIQQLSSFGNVIKWHNEKVNS